MSRRKAKRMRVPAVPKPEPAWTPETRAGPFFVDIGDRAPAEAPLIEG